MTNDGSPVKYKHNYSPLIVHLKERSSPMRKKGISSLQDMASSNRHICTDCHLVFAPYDPNKVLYAHPQGWHIEICYDHLMARFNQPGTCFVPIPNKAPKNFDLVKYLNDTRTNLLTQPLRTRRTQKTIRIITELLDETKLSKYVGGVAEFFSIGLKEMACPILITA